MTVNELQKLIDYVGEHKDRFKFDVYDKDKGRMRTIPGMPFDDFISLLSMYPVEESERACAPNYEVMYNDLVTKIESQRAEIKNLKTEKNILEHKLASAKGAIAMVEVVYGRKWLPSNLEMIR